MKTSHWEEFKKKKKKGQAVSYTNEGHYYNWMANRAGSRVHPGLMTHYVT